jgi:MFS transporter, NNP family, nitrate/nitrite transporter
MLQNLFSFRDRYRILHLTWLAFLITFACWFNFAPFAAIIRTEMGLTAAQIKTISLCNIATTIPARIVIGALLDRFGPRRTYASLLIFILVPCLANAFAQDFNQLLWSRLLMGIVGAGFVIGIRMVAEWFPKQEIGIAQGIYGGWGNFGAFVANFGLPLAATGLTFLLGGQSQWRLTIGLSGVIAAIYGVIYYFSVTDTPPSKEFKRPKKYGSIPVTSPVSFWALLAMNFGLIFALGLMVWQLAGLKIAFLSPLQMYGLWFLLACLYAYQTYQAWTVNKDVVLGKVTYSPAERYEFRQVALLQFTYATNFGVELTAVSMLPLFFQETFGLSPVYAPMIAACYSFLNLFSRPGGGILSDKLGSRKWVMTLTAVGIGIGYLTASLINKNWPLPLAIAVIMFAGLCAQAGCGSSFAMVPLIKTEITGQIAGNVGAYGNFGGVVYLTILSLSNNSTLFASMGMMALVCASCCAFFLREPRNSFGTDTNADPAMGTAQI